MPVVREPPAENDLPCEPLAFQREVRVDFLACQAEVIAGNHSYFFKTAQTVVVDVDRPVGRFKVIRRLQTEKRRPPAHALIHGGLQHRAVRINA